MRIIQILAPLCVTTMMFAGNAFLAKNAPLFADANGGSALGELIIASSVKELSKSGDFTEVEYVGFMPEGSTVVYEKAGVLMVGFEAANASNLKVLGQKKDEYDTVWINVSIKGFVKNDTLGSDKVKILDTGKSLFQGKCGSCHALHAESEFEPNVWPSILEAMGQQAGLSKAEKSSIEKYLQNFK
jgi:trimethylamine-N-oxide reductase cytochrome c-type subunit TorC